MPSFLVFVEQVVLELYAEGVRKLLCNCFAHFLVRIEDELDFSVAAVIYDEIVSVGFRTCVCMHCCVGGNVVFSGIGRERLGGGNVQGDRSQLRCGIAFSSPKTRFKLFPN